MVFKKKPNTDTETEQEQENIRDKMQVQDLMPGYGYEEKCSLEASTLTFRIRFSIARRIIWI